VDISRMRQTQKRVHVDEKGAGKKARATTAVGLATSKKKKAGTARGDEDVWTKHSEKKKRLKP